MIVIRPIDPEQDAEAAAAAIVDSSRHHTSLEPERYRILDQEAVAEDYRHGRQHPMSTSPDDRATLVAELDGRVVGLVDVRLAYPGGAHQALRYGYVAELAVQEADRRHGVGAALLRAAEDWARDRGCVYTVLDFNVRNADARRFYHDRMGYRPAGEIVLKEL